MPVPHSSFYFQRRFKVSLLVRNITHIWPLLIICFSLSLQAPSAVPINRFVFVLLETRNKHACVCSQDKRALQLIHGVSRILEETFVMINLHKTWLYKCNMDGKWFYTTSFNNSWKRQHICSLMMYDLFFSFFGYLLWYI